MSQVLMVLCHPSEKSFNHTVASEVAAALKDQGHTVLFHDLYGEGFDPILTFGELRRRFSFDDLVQRHYRDLEDSQGLIVVHPEWWNQPPAVLKGWIDRVLRPGIGYEFEGEEFMPKNRVPLLTDKRALLLATTDADPPADSSEEPLLAALWRETFQFCGMLDFHVRMLYAMRTIEPADRRAWLRETVEFACELFT